MVSDQLMPQIDRRVCRCLEGFRGVLGMFEGVVRVFGGVFQVLKAVLRVFGGVLGVS